MAKAEVEIDCGGEKHRIQLTDKGRLRLCNHPRRFWKTTEMQEAMGMECGCMDALRAWTREGYSTENHAFNKLISEYCWRPNHLRTMGALLPNGDVIRHGPDLLTLPLRERLRRRANREAMSALRTCRYDRLPWRNHKTFVRVAITHEPVQCGGGIDNHEPSLGTKAESWWSVTIRLSWLTRVHAVGLATLEGRFVLHAEPYTPRIWRITYARTRSKYKLRKSHGFAVKQPNGRFTLARHKSQIHSYLTCPVPA